MKLSLEDWINDYAGKIVTVFALEILEMNKNNYCVNVNGEIDNQTFNFLVNYLTYPKIKKPNTKVRGYTTTRNKRLFPSNELGKRTVIFIPKEDKEYDNVYASTGDGKTFIVDFGGKTKEIDFLITFEEPNLSEYTKTEYSIKPISEKSKKEIKKHQEDLTKIFAPVFLVLSILNIYCIENSVILKWPTVFLGIILSWWIAEAHNKALLKNRNYFIFLCLSMILFSTGIIYENILIKDFDKILAISFFHSFFMLLFYQILRPLYKMMFKKEPIVDRYNSSPSIIFYGLLIIFIPGVISFIMIENYLDYLSIKPK